MVLCTACDKERIRRGGWILIMELSKSDKLDVALEIMTDRQIDEYSDKIDIIIENNKNKYKEAYLILMEYWDCLPDEQKPLIDKRMKKLGL